MEMLLELMLELHLVRIWVSMGKIIEKLILMLEILHTHDGSMCYDQKRKKYPYGAVCVCGGGGVIMVILPYESQQ
jgi:hypothetical protein